MLSFKSAEKQRVALGETFLTDQRQMWASDFDISQDVLAKKSNYLKV